MEIVIESKLNIRCRGSRVALKRTFEFSFANYDTIDTYDVELLWNEYSVSK